jgi:hypothetical protein
MADGQSCIHCGYQETPHIYPDYGDPGDPPCSSFDDGVRHRFFCIKVDGERRCGGNCKAFMRGYIRRARAPINHSVYLVTLYGVIDIGG